MSQPTDSPAGPREQRALVAASLLFIAIGLLLLSLLLLEHATRIAARILIGASPQGEALPQVELTLALLGAFLLAWLACCFGWLRAIASGAPREPASTIALGLPLCAAILVLIAVIVNAHGPFGGNRGHYFFVAIVSGIFMVTPVTVSMIAMDAVRGRHRGGGLSCAKMLCSAQARSLLPVIIAGAIIGAMSMDRGRRPSDFDLALDMTLPLAIGVWAYWQGFQTLRAAVSLFRPASSPTPDAKA